MEQASISRMIQDLRISFAEKRAISRGAVPANSGHGSRWALCRKNSIAITRSCLQKEAYGCSFLVINFNFSHS